MLRLVIWGDIAPIMTSLQCIIQFGCYESWYKRNSATDQDYGENKLGKTRYEKWLLHFADKHCLCVQKYMPEDLFNVKKVTFLNINVFHITYNLLMWHLRM